VIAYSVGQITQLVIHWLALENNLYNYKQIPFCAIAGAIILLAIIIGTVIGEDKAYYEEPEEAIGYHPVIKTYDQYRKEAESKETAPKDSSEEDEVIPRIYGEN